MTGGKLNEPRRYRTVAVCGTCRKLKAGVTTIPTATAASGWGFHVCDGCIVAQERPLDDIVADLAGERP
jgi:hypothetical protein